MTMSSDRPAARQAGLLAEVRGGEGGDHTGHLLSRADVHRRDPRMRERAADEGHVQQAGQHDVVGPVGLAGEQPGVLLAGARLAEFGRRGLGFGGHGVTPASAARWTALTMFWYPVHRQRLPSSPSRISSSLGWGLVRSRSAAAMIMPGVQ